MFRDAYSMRRVIALLVMIVGLGGVPTHATVVSSKVTVTTTATALATVTFVEGRKFVEISHACAAAIFVGGSDVTTVNGRDINATQSLSMTLSGGETLYAIYASGTCSVTVLKSGS